ncbi:MAG: HAD family hydrolase, partial [Gemmatimonadales bacterium]
MKSERSVIPHLGYHLALMSGTVQRGSAAQPDTIIPIRSRGPLVLVVDLETLAGGKQDPVTQLSDQLRQRPHTSIIYAAPARSLNSARTCIEVLQLPSPDVLVVDQGASVQAADQHAALDVLDATIGARWPGAYAVRDPCRGAGPHARRTPTRGCATHDLFPAAGPAAGGSLVRRKQERRRGVCLGV